jgi:hypothetical protein
VPISDLEKEVLDVDGVAGDKGRWEIGSRGIYQRAAARLLAFCRLCDARKIVNPVVEDGI